METHLLQGQPGRASGARRVSLGENGQQPWEGVSGAAGLGQRIWEVEGTIPICLS